MLTIIIYSAHSIQDLGAIWYISAVVEELCKMFLELIQDKKITIIIKFTRENVRTKSIIKSDVCLSYPFAAKNNSMGHAVVK